MDYIQVSAKTVEDAVLEAAMKLATTREHLEYEVIEKGSAGFLGFGAKPAVIKARALSDEEIEKAEVKPEPVKEPVKKEVKKEVKKAEPVKAEKIRFAASFSQNVITLLASISEQIPWIYSLACSK